MVTQCCVSAWVSSDAAVVELFCVTTAVNLISASVRVACDRVLG